MAMPSRVRAVSTLCSLKGVRAKDISSFGLCTHPLIKTNYEICRYDAPLRSVLTTGLHPSLVRGYWYNRALSPTIINDVIALGGLDDDT